MSRSLPHVLVGVDFYPTYNFVTITRGGRETILKISVPTGHVGFINEVATNWPSQDHTTWQEWFIDNMRQPPGQIFTPIGVDLATTPMGALPNPRRFDPPIIVKHQVEFIGQNNSGRNYVFESLCRGTFYEKPNL